MKKIKYLKISILIIYLIILGRIFYLTILSNKFYYEQFLNQTNNIIDGSSAPRGRIIDEAGNILVDNIGIKTLYYNKLPSITESEELDIAASLGNVIKLNITPTRNVLQEYFYKTHKDEVDSRVNSDMLLKYKRRLIGSDDLIKYKYSLINEDELATLNPHAALIYHIMNKGYIYQEKTIKTNLNDEEFTKINELDLPGMRISLSWQRVYNYDTCLNVLFGNVGRIMKENVNDYLKNDYALDDIIGVSFLEKYYEETLRGVKAKYKVNGDNTLEKISDEIRGNDIVLEINIELQQQIEKIMKEEIIKAKKYASSKYYTGSYVVIADPNNGGLKAMVAYNYDGKNFNSDVVGLLTNSFTVGSVVKGASQSVAYKYRVIDEKTKVRDGCIKLFSQNEKCSWKNLGVINDIEALAYSSNYFQFLSAIKVSGNNYVRNMKFTPTRDDFNKYRDIFKSYGLGALTQIDILEEKKGIEGEQITGDLLLNLSIGQYDTYTPLMLSNYISTIAMNGNRYKLRVASKMISPEGISKEINIPEILNTVDLDLKYLKRVQKGLRQVAISGTGASYVNSKYQAASKTGTSETRFNNQNTITKSFVMYAPFDNPLYSMIIISPNISYENSSNNYKYPINSHLSRQISYILFDK